MATPPRGSAAGELGWLTSSAPGSVSTLNILLSSTMACLMFLSVRPDFLIENKTSGDQTQQRTGLLIAFIVESWFSKASLARS